MEPSVYNDYLHILQEELLPAMVCTEPIAVAYAAALAKSTLGACPTRVELCVSGNILKNVKSVIVPNTGGLKGICAAAAAGIVAACPERKLQVLSSLTPAQIEAVKEYLQSAEFELTQAPAGCVFDIRVRVFAGEHQAFVRIEGHHTNVVRIEKDGKKVQNKQTEPHVDIRQTDRGVLSVRGCIEFADSVRINDIREPIERQIEYNAAIADEGLRGDYGAQIGKVLLASFGNNVQNRAKAYAAAGSDARMNGCNLPVVIVSGSGNQGITASLPIVVYAREHNAPHEKLLRAVALSDLLTVHLKTGIGRLSAYCGAVSAGAGAGAGVCYLLGGGFDEIAHTLVNALAIDSGMICDGAKSSCAAKVAAAVEAGLTGMEMYRHGTQFFGGDGILTKGVEETIGNVCELARVGMRETDEEIIRLMLK